MISESRDDYVFSVYLGLINVLMVWMCAVYSWVLEIDPVGYGRTSRESLEGLEHSVGQVLS